MTAPAMMMPTPAMDPETGQPYGADALRDLFGPEAFGGRGSPSTPNEIAAPNPPEDEELRESVQQYRTLMEALYGSNFPLVRAFDVAIGENPEYEQMGQMPPLDVLLPLTHNDEWAVWVRDRWSLHAPAVQQHLFLVARNRLFRAGQQWVSSRGIGNGWKEPPKPAESARVVHNLIAPALDQQLQIIIDQRPGFSVDPTALSPDEKRKAEGRQQGLEFQYDQQKMPARIKEASYWAQTDGVAFLHTYWDRDKGPWQEGMGSSGQHKPLGDLNTKVDRCEHVRVSANATATEPPYYLIVRDALSETESAYLYGVSGVQQSATFDQQDGGSYSSGTGVDGVMPSWVLTQTVVGEGNRLSNIKTVERFTMYVDRHPDILPEGLQLVVVGNAVVWGPGELLFGVIPVTPYRDGSTDPSYFPRPRVEQWIPPQMRINASLSLWVNSVRVNSGGRFLSRPNAISRETFMGSGCSIMEVETQGQSLGDVIQPVNGFLVGQDVKDLIAFDVKAFEDMSGYNDVSRGQLSGETATAVSIANEQLQRVFAPPVGAAAESMEGWATVQLAGMAWGYDVARDVGAIGSDRPDLARALSAEDFAGPSTVRVEADKMMPTPRIYRQAQLDTWYDKGLITPQQYMRNAKFASFKGVTSPDEDQEARAKRVADALRLQLPPEQVPPIRWQTNEAIEQDVLEREVLLQDDLPPEVILAADQRWRALAAQAAMKQGGLPAMSGGSAPLDGPESGSSAPLPTDGSPTPAPAGGEPMPPSPATPEPLTMSDQVPVPQAA